MFLSHLWSTHHLWWNSPPGLSIPPWVKTTCMSLPWFMVVDSWGAPLSQVVWGQCQYMSVAGVIINGAPLDDPPCRQPEGHLAGGVGGSIPFPSGAVRWSSCSRCLPITHLGSTFLRVSHFHPLHHHFTLLLTFIQWRASHVLQIRQLKLPRLSDSLKVAQLRARFWGEPRLLFFLCLISKIGGKNFLFVSGWVWF